MPRKTVRRAEGVVPLRITKFGGGKVSTGRHLAGTGDEYFAAGAVAELPREVALALERRGFGEIQDGP